MSWKHETAKLKNNSTQLDFSTRKSEVLFIQWSTSRGVQTSQAASMVSWNNLTRNAVKSSTRKGVVSVSTCDMLRWSEWNVETLFEKTCKATEKIFYFDGQILQETN